MEYIKAEAAYIMNLDAEPKPSEHPWPPRLILQNPDHDPKKPTTFANMYADQYRGNIIKTWRLDNATQHRLKDTPTARYTDSGHAATASLRAIVVPSEAHQRHILLMEQDTFLRLFDSMKLDRYGLCLYLTNVPGLHSLGRRSKDSSVLGFFLNAIDYAFIWSYDPKMRATNAVIIGEVDQACKTNQLLGAIKRTENAVVFNPLYLAFLACSEGFLMNCEFDYASVKSPGRRLRGETMDMGHNSTNRELRDFSEASLSHGKSLTNGVRRLRVVQTLQDVVNQLDGSWEGTIWGETAGRVAAMADDDRRSSSAGRTDALQQSNVEIQAAIPWLRSQLACRVAHFEAHIGWAKTSLRVVGLSLTFSVTPTWVRTDTPRPTTAWAAPKHDSLGRTSERSPSRSWSSSLQQKLQHCSTYRRRWRPRSATLSCTGRLRWP